MSSMGWWVTCTTPILQTLGLSAGGPGEIMSYAVCGKYREDNKRAADAGEDRPAPKPLGAGLQCCPRP